MRKKLYPLLSFLIPLAIILTAFAASHVYPFGDYNAFISDGNGYYINYFAYWKRVLNGQESLLYSFTKNLGGSTVGLIAYHLLNPFLILLSFCNLDRFPLIYTIVILLTISSCGLTMYIYLDECFKNHGSNLIFSTSYALMGYCVVNRWQVQWLTGVVLFPLVVLGIKKILQNKSGLLYIISLALTLITNFYIGYMVVIASTITFLTSFFCLSAPRDRRLVGKYSISTLLAGGLSSFIWIPTLLSLKGGRASASNLLTFSFIENGKILAILAKLFTGMHSLSELQKGLPVIFSGIIPLFLCILFFLDLKVDKQRKRMMGMALGIYILSFYINTISVIFQGFSYTVWFNFRYSFIFSFLIISIAAEEYYYIHRVSNKLIKVSITVLAIVTVLVFSENLSFADKPSYLIDMAFLLLISGALLWYRRNPIISERRALTMLVLLCVSLNLYANMVISMQEEKDWFESYADTVSGIKIKENIVNYVQGQDDSFYRMESESNRAGSTCLDPMMFGYNGTSHAGSVEKSFVKQNAIKFGIQWMDNRNSYSTGMSASMDSLLGLKYLISSRNLTDEKGYKLMNSVMGIGIYKNPYTLPIAIVSKEDLSKLDISEEHDVFAIQNEVWKSIVGEKADLYSEERDINYTSHNISDAVTINSISFKKNSDNDNNSAGAVWQQVDMNSVITDENEKAKANAEDGSYIEISFTASYSGPYYCYAYGYEDESYGSATDMLTYLGTYKKGDTVTTKLPMTGTVTKEILESSVPNTYIACLHQEVLAQYSTKINEEGTSIEKENNNDSKLYGSFKAEKGQQLFFTIPYDEGWRLYVDGSKVKLSKTFNLFMSAEIPSGDHDYRLVYWPSGLTIGIIVNIISLGISTLFELSEQKKKHSS